MTKLIPLLALAAVSAATSIACHKDGDSTKGPMERAGESVDSAAHSTKEGAKNAAEDVKDAFKDAG